MDTHIQQSSNLRDSLMRKFEEIDVSSGNWRNSEPEMSRRKWLWFCLCCSSCQMLHWTLHKIKGRSLACFFFIFVFAAWFFRELLALRFLLYELYTLSFSPFFVSTLISIFSIFLMDLNVHLFLSLICTLDFIFYLKNYAINISKFVPSFYCQYLIEVLRLRNSEVQ